MEQTVKKAMSVDELMANYHTVSVHKYAFFLCRAGTARVMLGTGTYRLAHNYLCLYPPNTFCQILERSDDLAGLFEEVAVDEYYPVASVVDIRKRIKIRNAPCVKIPEAQAEGIMRLYDMIREDKVDTDGDSGTPTDVDGIVVKTVRDHSRRYLRYALCLKVLEAYFGNSPVEAMPYNKDDLTLNRFLVSLHENCHRQRTVQYYADQQHLSPYYFSSIIRKWSGKSASQWIVEVTMNLARQYLECSEMSIKEIADRLHFPDQSTFGRYFKHHEGRTPSDFKRGKLKSD